MIHIYYFFLWGYFKNHKSRILFSLTGIALGIALFFTTQVNSWRAEESIIDTQVGYPDKSYIGQFLSNAEGNFGDESILKDLYFQIPESIEMQPNITEDAFIEDDKMELQRFPLIGKDFIRNFQSIKDGSRKTENRQIKFLISQTLFQKIFNGKESATIAVCEQKISIKKAESLELAKDGSFVATDIQYLQKFCHLEGKMQRVLLSQEDGTSPKEASLDQVIQFAKTKNWTWESKDFIRERSGKALSSLKINLTIVSLISVLISFFMVANTFSGIYLARRKEFGILLSIGNSRIQNLFLFLSQGLVLGTIGSLFGIVIGLVLLNFDLLLGSNTITDNAQITSYHQFHPWIYLGSFGIGIFGSLISSLFSSLRSYFIRPIELIREKDSSQGFRDLNALFVSSAITGVIFCLVGLGIGFIPAPKSLLPGLLGVGLVIFGFILIFPLALISFIQLILNTIDRFFFWPTFRIAWEEIKLEPLQNTLTSATILLASSLVLTLTSLTDSYEKTLVRWVDDDNPFDFSIINASKLASGLPGVPLELLKTLEKNSNIQKLEPFIIKTKFPVQDNFYTLHVYPFESKENEIIVSTNFCYLENKCQGDWVEIQTEKEGKINFYIKGEKEHFFSERGTIMMNFENYQKYFSNSKLNSIRVSFFTTVTPEKKVSYLETEIKAYGGELKLLDQASLKSLYLEGMRSVFSILETLKISAVIISFLALLTSLIYNIKEKSKLIATLRTIGLSRNQLFKILFFQSTFFISLGLGLGILNSLFVSPLVIFGVNRNAFGWTLEFHYPVTELIYLLFIIPGTALLVSIYPYLEAKSKTIREALNYE